VGILSRRGGDRVVDVEGLGGKTLVDEKEITPCAQGPRQSPHFFSHSILKIFPIKISFQIEITIPIKEHIPNNGNQEHEHAPPGFNIPKRQISVPQYQL
jgi:hypothetical protein